MRYIIGRLNPRGLPNEALIEVQRLTPERAMRWAHTQNPHNWIRRSDTCAEYSRSLAPLQTTSHGNSKLVQLQPGDEALILTPTQRGAISSATEVEFTLMRVRQISI